MSAGTWGGAREGAGRKPADWVPPEGRADYEIERARHEKIKADQREFALAKERGEYLPRDAVRQASATVMAMLAQSLRSLPDNLERTLNLPPAAVEAVSVQIDAALAELAAGMKAMTRDE